MGNEMDAITMITLATLVWKLVELIKNAVNQKWDPVFTQVVVWIAGVVVVWIAAQANVAATIDIWGTALDQLNFASLVLVGLSISSFGSAAVEVKKAVDSNDSATQTSLIPASS
jgi:hypothetical protein